MGCIALDPTAAQAQVALMLKALLHITLPENDGNFPGDPDAEDRHVAPIQLALEAMIAVNRWHIERGLKRLMRGIGLPVPPLYASGVRYKEDPPGEENWKDCLAVLADGHGDCDRVCAWRIAELRAMGHKAEPVIKYQKVPKAVMVQMGHPAHMVPEDGILMIHVAVRGPRRALKNPTQQADGSWVEDPSKLLGMGGAFTNGV